MAAKVQKLHFESRFSHFAHQQVSSLNAALCCGVVWYRHGRAFCKTPLLLPPPPYLRYEQHGRGDEQEQEPVGDAKGRDTEHAAAEGDDDDLTCENERGNQQETAGGGNVREGGMVRGEGAGVEHVPQLEQHEEREEEAFFIAREQPAAVMRGREEGGEGGDIEKYEIFCQSHQDCRKQQPRAEQAFPHGAGDDKVVATARLLVHYLA